MQGHAIYAVQPNVVELRSIAVDESQLAPDRLLVQTRYSVISAGTELDCLSGRESGWFHLPDQLGYCAVSEVLARGEAVTDYAVGDLVLSTNGHATFAVVGPGGTRGKIPDGSNPLQAPLLHMALIAMASLRLSRIELGDFVVVLGQGLVGNLAAQLAKAQGGRVIAIDRVAARLEISRRCGLDMLVNSAETEAVQAVKELTAGRGAEIIIEATGAAPAALQGIEMADAERRDDPARNPTR